MTQREFEMPEEYKTNLAHLTEFLEAREEWRATIEAAAARGKRISAADKALVDATLRDFDEKIDGLEKLLAEEYERYQAEQAKEAKISEMVADMWETQKQIYIIIKHQEPHMLDSFTEAVLDPLPPDMLEEFLDEVAILESTKLDAILKGEE